MSAIDIAALRALVTACYTPHSSWGLESVSELLRQAPALLSRLERCEAVVAKVAALDGSDCVMCNGGFVGSTFRHADDCAWVESRKLREGA